MNLNKYILAAFLLLAGVVGLHSGVHNIADISGTSAAVAIVSGSPFQARWIQFVAPSGNAANVRFGDSTTSATVGGVLVAGSGQMLPPCNGCVYPLSGTFVYVASGDTVRVIWGD